MSDSMAYVGTVAEEPKNVDTDCADCVGASGLCVSAFILSGRLWYQLKRL